jgi:uncharacterized protein (DUF433 family)
MVSPRWRALNRYTRPARWGTLARMTEELLNRITIEPGKCGGRPCVRGLRIRVTDILELLANDASTEEILADYPGLERADILASIAYAARMTHHSVIQVA